MVLLGRRRWLRWVLAAAGLLALVDGFATLHYLTIGFRRLSLDYELEPGWSSMLVESVAYMLRPFGLSFDYHSPEVDKGLLAISILTTVLLPGPTRVHG